MKTCRGTGEIDPLQWVICGIAAIGFLFRYLRNPDAASYRASGAAGIDQRHARISGVPDVGRTTVLHSRICRRHRWRCLAAT